MAQGLALYQLNDLVARFKHAEARTLRAREAICLHQVYLFLFPDLCTFNPSYQLKLEFAEQKVREAVLDLVVWWGQQWGSLQVCCSPTTADDRRSAVLRTKTPVVASGTQSARAGITEVR
jgi:hypothetical protein